MAEEVRSWIPLVPTTEYVVPATGWKTSSRSFCPGSGPALVDQDVTMPSTGMTYDGGAAPVDAWTKWAALPQLPLGVPVGEVIWPTLNEACAGAARTAQATSVAAIDLTSDRP
jgi:hypothetical protein